MTTWAHGHEADRFSPCATCQALADRAERTDEQAEYEVTNLAETVLDLLRRNRELEAAINAAKLELGVPTADYPAPVANAVKLLDAVVADGRSR